MRIAVDAMGTDNRPGPDVAGAVMAARAWKLPITLVGDQARVEAELARQDHSGLDISIVHASQDILMTDKPTESASEKPDSSMHVGLGLLKEGQADAFVSAGNTGALLAIALLHTIGRIRGIKRPAITAMFPTLKGYVISADIGANADCKPEYLVQFAQMGSLYARIVLGVEHPRVALLSNGEEAGKGNDLVKAAFPVLQETAGLNFVGNVEPKMLLSGEFTDVVVHDGFTGNVMIKSLEAALRAMRTMLKEEIQANPITTLGGLLARPAFNRVGERMSEETIGGAPLLGLNGVVISAHGSSTALAMKNAVLRAKQAVDGDLISKIQEQMGQAISS